LQIALNVLATTEEIREQHFGNGLVFAM